MNTEGVNIRAIVFDYGNVISMFDWGLFRNKLLKKTSKKPWEIQRAFDQSKELLKKHELGLISTDEFFDEMHTRLSLKMTRIEFFDAWEQIFTPIPQTRSLIKRLKDHYKIGLISNTCESHYESEIYLSDVFNLFDSVSLSFEVHALKPSAVMYQDALNKLSLPSSECVYIDDIENFVEAASEMGFYGVHYKDPQSLERSLDELSIQY